MPTKAEQICLVVANELPPHMFRAKLQLHALSRALWNAVPKQYLTKCLRMCIDNECCGNVYYDHAWEAWHYHLIIDNFTLFANEALLYVTRHCKHIWAIESHHYIHNGLVIFKMETMEWNYLHYGDDLILHMLADLRKRETAAICK